MRGIKNEQTLRTPELFRFVSRRPYLSILPASLQHGVAVVTAHRGGVEVPGDPGRGKTVLVEGEMIISELYYQV